MASPILVGAIIVSVGIAIGADFTKELNQSNPIATNSYISNIKTAKTGLSVKVYLPIFYLSF